MSEPRTQASTEVEEGTIYHRYGTISLRKKLRQTGRGGMRGLKGVKGGRGGWLVITVSHNIPNKHCRDVLTEETDRGW